MVPESSLDEALAEIADQEAELDEQGALAEEQAARIAELEDRVADLEARLSAQSEELAGMAQELSVARQDAETWRLEAQTALREVASLEERRAELETTIDELLVAQLTFFTQDRLLYETSKYDELVLGSDSAGEAEAIDGTEDPREDDPDEGSSTGPDVGETDSGDVVPFAAAAIILPDAPGLLAGTQLRPDRLAGTGRTVVSTDARGRTYYFDERVDGTRPYLTLVVVEESEAPMLYLQVGSGALAENDRVILGASIRLDSQELSLSGANAVLERRQEASGEIAAIRRRIDGLLFPYLSRVASGEAPISVSVHTPRGPITFSIDRTQRIALVNMLYVFGEVGGVYPATAAATGGDPLRP